jgi:AcrR family transcriptional regulator
MVGLHTDQEHLMSPAQPRVNREERETRRQIILDAAQDLIIEAGLEGFRIREVAERSEMHHASMLHYFPSREALLRGVVERIVSHLDRVPVADVAVGWAGPSDALHAHFQHVLAQMQAHPGRFVVLNELFVRAVRDQEVRNVLAATDLSWRQFLVPLLATGVAQGVFRADLDPEAVAVIITSFFKGLSLHLGLAPAHLSQAVAQLEQWIGAEGGAQTIDTEQAS